jgi:hypothetical protein
LITFCTSCATSLLKTTEFLIFLDFISNAQIQEVYIYNKEIVNNIHIDSNEKAIIMKWKKKSIKTIAYIYYKLLPGTWQLLKEVAHDVQKVIKTKHSN